MVQLEGRILLQRDNSIHDRGYHFGPNRPEPLCPTAWVMRSSKFVSTRYAREIEAKLVGPPASCLRGEVSTEKLIGGRTQQHGQKKRELFGKRLRHIQDDSAQ